MEFEQACPHCGKVAKVYRNPFPTVDIVVIRDGMILLIERKNPPPGWAIPGGFVDYGESAESAAARELSEETGMTVETLELVGVYSAPDRDPRFHTFGAVYLAEAGGEPVAGDDAANAKWFRLNELPEQIAFDHRQVIRDAVRLYDSRNSVSRLERPLS